MCGVGAALFAPDKPIHDIIAGLYIEILTVLRLTNWFGVRGKLRFAHVKLLQPFANGGLYLLGLRIDVLLNSSVWSAEAHLSAMRDQF